MKKCVPGRDTALRASLDSVRSASQSKRHKEMKLLVKILFLSLYAKIVELFINAEVITSSSKIRREVQIPGSSACMM